MSSTSIVNSSPMLSKAFRGSGSDKMQDIPARSNQFVRDVQLLSYFYIRIWRSVGVVMDIKSGKLSAGVDAIVADMDPVAFGS
jgi:hypothetical protein